MQSRFRFFSLFLFLLFSNIQFVSSQTPVSETVVWLDSALAHREIPVLHVPQDNPEGFEAPLTLGEDLSGTRLEDGQYSSLKPGLTVALRLAGKYKLNIDHGTGKIVLAYGGQHIQLTQNTTIEQAPFWIRLTGSTRDTVLWKEDALSIVAYLALASGLVSPADIPVEPSRWMSILSSLEKNSFFSAELADIRPSVIPTTHPFIHDLAEHLKQYATGHAQFFESVPLNPPLSATSGPSYFSLQDMQKHYDNPLISDVATELRSAGKRIARGEGKGLNTAAIVGGLTDFAIERAKEEFSIALLERMQYSINGSEKGEGLRELRILFPQTWGFFSGQQKLSNFKNLLPSARASFLKDLQTLGTQVQELLSIPPYDTLKHNKDIYNLALFYDIASMAYQGMPLDTLLENVASRLNRRQEQLFLQGNQDLASNQTTKPDLTVLQTKLSSISADLDTLGKDILRKNITIEATGFFDLEMAASAIGAQAIEEYRKLYDGYLDETTRRNESLILWMAKDRHEQLQNIPRQLEGFRYYEQLLRYPKLENYPNYFGEAPDTLQLIASGVELSRKLVNPPPGEQPMPEFMVGYYRYLQGVEQVIKEKTALFRTFSPNALQARKRDLDAKRSTLERQLEADSAFWSTQKERRLEDHIAALRFLKNALDTINDPSWRIADNLDPTALKDAVQRYEQRLKTAEGWARERMDTLRAASGIAHPMPPALEWQSPTVTTSPVSQDIEARLNRITATARDINSLILRMDTTHIPQIHTSRNQALLLSNIAEMSLAVLSCLKAPDGSPTKYLTPTEFWDLMRDDRSRNLFLGLVQEHVQKVSNNSSLSPKNVAVVTSRFVDIAFQADQLLDSLRNPTRTERRFSDYLPLVGLGVDLLVTVIENPLIANDRKDPLAIAAAKELTSFPKVTGHAFSLFSDLQAERYGSAIQNLVNMLSTVATSSPNVESRWQRTSQELLFYGNFMANVASAQNADDMRSALLGAALPPGSSRVKREESFNIGLNTYLGLGGGVEVLNNGDAMNKTAGTIGLSLPVGLSVSWKFKKEHALSYSVLLSVLDLGAVAAFRLGDPGAEALPDLKIENFVAPGAYFLFNIPRSPFSLGVGSQYGPRVRSITAANGVQSQASAWRWGGFIGMDVPIFSFSTMRVRTR
jgi:hypothetical protein